MRILVTGKSGQLAQALAHLAPAAMDIAFHGRDTMDLATPGAAAGRIGEVRPDLVINAAAWTAVDQAETERDAAWRLNAGAPGEIARACAGAGAALIHVSTDYVYDGAKAGPYIETDATAPINAYGASKLAGEQEALAGNPRSIVLRTSWVYSPWGKNFVLTMLGLAGRPRLRVVDDQRGTPTSALDLAEVCLANAPRLTGTAAGDPVWGVYHYAGQGACSWADLAEETFALAGPPRPEIERIPAAEYPTPARRPANSVLDCKKFETTFGCETVPWKCALARVVSMHCEGSKR